MQAPRSMRAAKPQPISCSLTGKLLKVLFSSVLVWQELRPKRRGAAAERIMNSSREMC